MEHSVGPPPAADRPETALPGMTCPIRPSMRHPTRRSTRPPGIRHRQRPSTHNQKGSRSSDVLLLPPADPTIGVITGNPLPKKCLHQRAICVAAVARPQLIRSSMSICRGGRDPQLGFSANGRAAVIYRPRRKVLRVPSNLSCRICLPPSPPSARRQLTLTTTNAALTLWRSGKSTRAVDVRCSGWRFTRDACNWG